MTVVNGGNLAQPTARIYMHRPRSIEQVDPQAAIFLREGGRRVMRARTYFLINGGFTAAVAAPVHIENSLRPVVDLTPDMLLHETPTP